MDKEVFQLQGQKIRIEDIVKVARDGIKVEFSSEYQKRIESSNRLLLRFVEEGRLIYGVTTGFGKNMDFVISPKDAKRLQENIIRSHSAAVGEPLPREIVRAYLFMVLCNAGKGYSGTSPHVLEQLRQMLNCDILAYAPSEGNIGSLSTEAFIALAAIGEGMAYREGKLMTAKQALRESGLTPISLSYKDGLSIISGSALSCAWAALAAFDIRNGARHLNLSAAMTFEALEGNTNAFDQRLHELKHHRDQHEQAQWFRSALSNSVILADSKHKKLQDPCFLRVLPHVHGSAQSMLSYCWGNVENEINSVSDNPLIYPENAEYTDGEGLMGGNFDSSYITLACDGMALAASMMAKLSDKRVDRLNDRQQSGLPPFLSGMNPGLNSGFMIPQYTVAGLFSEISHLSTPLSVQSVSTCAGHESPATMASLSASRLFQIGRKLQYIAAIELMMACQGVEWRGSEKSSPFNHEIFKKIRTAVPSLEDDRCYSGDIEKILAMIKNGDLIK